MNQLEEQLRCIQATITSLKCADIPEDKEEEYKLRIANLRAEEHQILQKLRGKTQWNSYGNTTTTPASNA